MQILLYDNVSIYCNYPVVPCWSLSEIQSQVYLCKRTLDLEMPRAHIFMARTGPYPSQQPVTEPAPITPPKLWPVPGPAHKMAVSILPHKRQNRHCWRYFVFCVHKAVDHLQCLDEDM